jgi:hypothetical protein
MRKKTTKKYEVPNRERLLSVRFTVEEFERLERAAAEQRVRLSDWCRQTLLRKAK